MPTVVYRWMVLLVAILVAEVKLAAQDFNVQQFRTLPNDISAYITPEYDLNHEACALLKVVCEDRFAFSTPLGIVRRKNEVGEVWLYVPHGTRMITLKHPQWGVLRDYVFPMALESRMTYELVIQPPLDVRIERFWRIDARPKRLTVFTHLAQYDLKVLPVSELKRIPMKWEAYVSAMLAAGKDVLPGIKVGLLKNHGVYLSVYSDFGNWNRVKVGVCDANGYMVAEGYTPYYTGRTASGELLLLAGAVHRLHPSWYVYEGGGYGIRRVYWQLAEGDWVCNAGHSVEGWSAETGVIYRYRRYMFSGGVVTLKGSYWMGVLGVGMCF